MSVIAEYQKKIHACNLGEYEKRKIVRFEECPAEVVASVAKVWSLLRYAQEYAELSEECSQGGGGWIEVNEGYFTLVRYAEIRGSWSVRRLISKPIEHFLEEETLATYLLDRLDEDQPTD